MGSMDKREAAPLRPAGWMIAVLTGLLVLAAAAAGPSLINPSVRGPAAAAALELGASETRARSEEAGLFDADGGVAAAWRGSDPAARLGVLAALGVTAVVVFGALARLIYRLRRPPASALAHGGAALDAAALLASPEARRRLAAERGRAGLAARGLTVATGPPAAAPDPRAAMTARLAGMARWDRASRRARPAASRGALSSSRREPRSPRDPRRPA